MKSAIYMDGNRFMETEFNLEQEFETIVKNNARTLFGKNTIYFDIKKKINTKTLGGTIPDGFLFDFSNVNNPEFYLVEVELAKHDFDRHIFPQIKKFFSFYKNQKSLDHLIGFLFNYIKENSDLEKEFKKYIGEKEIYKTLKDTLENSQNILLIIDEYKPEFDETSETITEWAKLVKVEVLKQYRANNKSIFTLNPDFEDIGIIELISQESEEKVYNEGYHLADASETVTEIFKQIKQHVYALDTEIALNPQKYYISLRKRKNFAFIQVRKKKINLVVMLPYNTGVKLIKKHKLITLTEGIQKFYGAPCFSVAVESSENIAEVFKAVDEAYKQQNK